MGKKWQRVDPAEIRVGDWVKRKRLNHPTIIGRVSDVRPNVGYVRIGITPYVFESDTGGCTWYVRRPKPAKDTYYAELEAEVKELEAERDELRATLDELDAALLAPEPPTRPDEPPVGTFFRVERTGNVYLRRVCQGLNCASDYLLVVGYHNGLGPSCTGHWYDFTEPGDTITILELVEVKS